MGTSAEQPGDIYAIRFRPAECQCQTSKKDIRSRGGTPAGPASIVRGRIRSYLAIAAEFTVPRRRCRINAVTCGSGNI